MIYKPLVGWSWCCGTGILLSLFFELVLWSCIFTFLLFRPMFSAERVRKRHDIPLSVVSLSLVSWYCSREGRCPTEIYVKSSHSSSSLRFETRHSGQNVKAPEEAIVSGASCAKLRVREIVSSGIHVKSWYLKRVVRH